MIKFIKPTTLKILIALTISYFIVPIFSQPSLCLDLLAQNPKDTSQSSYAKIPCVKLETISSHLRPIYITKNRITYQQNANYYYDLSSKYVNPALNISCAYVLASGMVYCFSLIKGYIMSNTRKNLSTTSIQPWE